MMMNEKLLHSSFCHVWLSCASKSPCQILKGPRLSLFDVSATSTAECFAVPPTQLAATTVSVTFINIYTGRRRRPSKRNFPAGFSERLNVVAVYPFAPNSDHSSMANMRLLELQIWITNRDKGKRRMMPVEDVDDWRW